MFPRSVSMLSLYSFNLIPGCQSSLSQTLGPQAIVTSCLRNSLLSSTGDRLSFRGRPPRPLLVIFQWLPPALGIRQKLPDTLSQRAWFGSALMPFLTACLLTPFPCHCLARVVPPLVLTSTLPSTLHYLLTPPGWAAFPASKCSYPELDPQPSGSFPTAVLCLINAPKKPCN